MNPEKTVEKTVDAAAPDAELGLHGGVRGHEVEIPPDEALRENWLKTGEHPEAKPKEPTETASKQSEGEKAIAALSHEERERWMLTGEMPKKPAVTEKPAEKKAEPEKPGESATEPGEPKHILSRHAVLGEPIDNVKHQEAVNSYADRFSKDFAASGETREEVEAVLTAAKKIQPELPSRMVTFMENAYPHLQHPFHFVRKFYTDPALRARILAEDARANAKGILKIMAKVDGEIASDIALRRDALPPRRVTQAPAPGTNGAGGGRRTAPRDATVSALKAGDFEAYMNAENEKQEAALRRGERY